MTKLIHTISMLWVFGVAGLSGAYWVGMYVLTLSDNEITALGASIVWIAFIFHTLHEVIEGIIYHNPPID